MNGPAHATQATESRPLSLQAGGVPAQAQETVLHSFASGSDGANPIARLTDINGVLYGTTPGPFAGTFFKITTSGAESVLYTFQSGSGSDGANPHAGLTDVNGVFYGTTYFGGDANNDGTVFKIAASGAESVLYTFKGGNDGAHPAASLTNVDGVLYGTTFSGGDADGDGTVFKVTASGAESVLHRFAGGNDGSQPYASLTDIGDVLYGTTYYGGDANGDGTVFKITTSGTENVLHTFGSGTDGVAPYAGLTNVNGVLYGTTRNGGTFHTNGSAFGNGTVFKVTTSGAEHVLHSFGGGSDGRNPFSGLTNVNGVLYGTTYYGGAANNGGTVFKITTSGVKSAVYSFLGGSDGSGPYADLTNVNGALYGTTFEGGADNKGTVFALSL
jgi:uncharacterized repeat protein (TIGR03803 family)